MHPASNSIHLFENDNFKIFNNLTIVISRIVSWSNMLLGMLGTLLMMPVIFFFLMLITAELIRLNKKLASLITDVNNLINEGDDNVIIRLHLEAERFKKDLWKKSQILLEAEGAFLKPANNQLKRLNKQVSELEATLYKAAYPEIHKEPTEEQQKRLLKTFSDMDDWYDSDLDEYGDVYIK
jgi:hypothetical protein